ncbi:MAG: hypothetical protein ICV84_18645 [Flavisolibacter sp.]|nr:hypothetical protein [Flavisolibacter sp.]
MLTKILIIVLKALIGFVGITALLSGPYLIADPSGKSIHFPEGTLAGTPFPDFLIPGFILTFLVGLYSFVVLLWLLFPKLIPISVNSPLQLRWYAAFGTGISIIVFITTQLLLIPFRMFLQPLYLTIGLLICGICLLPNVRNYFKNNEKPTHKMGY